MILRDNLTNFFVRLPPLSLGLLDWDCWIHSSIRLHCPKWHERFHGSTGKAEGNPLEGSQFLMLIYSRTIMKISEKS
jgi:hypothetical protein